MLLNIKYLNINVSLSSKEKNYLYNLDETRKNILIILNSVSDYRYFHLNLTHGSRAGWYAKKSDDVNFFTSVDIAIHHDTI